MSHWSGCRIEVRAGGELEFADDDCDVRIESGKLTLTYFDDEGPVVFIGREASGGFELVCRSRPRTATLRRTGATLHGTWKERDQSGSWTIRLPR
ncbi:MAG: hypothetical protein V3V67_16375 [Myxococcota bacterium]